MRARTATRRPSGRYSMLSTNGAILGAPGGVRRDLAGPHELVDVAAELAGGAEAVVWVHESALAAWELGTTLGPDHADSVAGLLGREVRGIGDSGWLAVDHAPQVHLAFPAYSGDFMGLDNAGELLAAVELYRQAVGLGYLISAAKTTHTLIGILGHVTAPVEPEPVLEGYTPSAWSVPAMSWGLTDLELLEAAGRRWVRCFDRSGTYLAAWTGISLPDGKWIRHGAGVLEAGAESGKPAGYWLIDRADLPDGEGWYDPFRRLGDAPGPVWLTTPLAQLATELAGAPVPYLEALVGAERVRALDPAATRLREARDALRAKDTPAAAAALEVVKGGYSAATNWMEYSVQFPAPLARPAWRRSILDRFAANTYRALAKMSPAPFAVTDVDAAMFALVDVDEIPDGMRVGSELGSWKPKGRPVAIADARAALERGGHHALVQLAEQL